MNISVTLGTQSLEVPLHPLDMSQYPANDASATSCNGLIQSDDAALAPPLTSPGDFILGVPFLRNVYTVLAYDRPSAAGAFPPAASEAAGGDISPHVGVLALTDPGVAMAEFNTVRVQRQPLPSIAGGGGGTDTPAGGGGGKKALAIGLRVLLGLGCFIAVCAMLFVGRMWMMRRKVRREGKDYELGNVRRKGSRKGRVASDDLMMGLERYVSPLR